MIDYVFGRSYGKFTLVTSLKYLLQSVANQARPETTVRQPFKVELYVRFVFPELTLTTSLHLLSPPLYINHIKGFGFLFTND